MSVTQKQIAEYLGISRPLVAEALRGHPRIAERTRLRVEQAARELGYDAHSNSAARSLIAQRYNKSIRTGIIALTMPSNFDGVQLNKVPFFTPFFDGAGAEAESRGLEICLCPLSSEIPRLISGRSVDGVVVLGDVSIVPALREIKLPVVVLDVYCSDTTHIIPADREGMRKVTQHLIDGGHTRIAYISHALTYPSTQERFAGFQSAHHDSGLVPDESLWCIDLNHSQKEFGAAAMKRLLKGKKSKPDFTAVVCYHDLFAIGAVQALQEAGLRVPEDVSVVGFDDVSTDYSFVPAITSISFDRRAMGARAVSLLCATIEGGEAEIEGEVFPVELMVRASSRRLN